MNKRSDAEPRPLHSSVVGKYPLTNQLPLHHFVNNAAGQFMASCYRNFKSALDEFQLRVPCPRAAIIFFHCLDRRVGSFLLNLVEAQVALSDLWRYKTGLSVSL